MIPKNPFLPTVGGTPTPSENIFAVPKKAKEKIPANQPLWMDILDVISRPQRAITGGLANITDKDAKTTFLQGVVGGITGKEKKDFDEILNNLGWKQQEANLGYNIAGTKGKFDLFDIANLAGNVAFDPLTYLTFGAGSAVKIGTKAMQEAALNVAKRSGVAFDDWKNVANNIYKKTYNDEISKGSAIDVAESLAKDARDVAQKEIADAGRAARATAQNRVVNFDVPFTNVAKGFGQKGNIPLVGKFLKVTDQEIGEAGARGVNNLLDNLGISRYEKFKFLKDVYNVKNPANLTVQMFEDLTRRVTEYPTTSALYKGKTDRFVADMYGRSALGRVISRNVFNPRTLRSKSDFINLVGKYRTQAANRVIGRRKVLGKTIEETKKLVNDFTDDELRAVTYLIEKSFPKGMDRETFLSTLPNPDKVLKVVPEFERLIKEITDEELRSGVLTEGRLLGDYFPHVFTNKFNMEDIQRLQEKFRNDPDIGQFFGKTSASRFSRERKSFRYLSQLQDKLDFLVEQQSLGNPTGIKDLDEKIRVLSNLFERTPVEAVGKRYYASIRSVAMKDLQNTLSDTGLLVYAKDVTEIPPSGYIRIDRELSGQLGIPENSYINPEVLEGLKTTVNLFTDEGLNGLVGSLQSLTNIWKTITTSILPSHYWFNFIGNTAANLMVGVKLSSYKEAVRLIEAYRLGKLTPEESSLVKYAFDTGVLGQTSSADLRILAEDPRTTKLQKAEDYLQEKIAPIRETLGDAPDHMFRMAHFLHMLDNTQSMEMAADSVRKHLFNYNELTPTDKFFKVAFPFWNWAKNNLPLQLHKFMTQPRYAANYERIRQQTLGDTKDDENAPEWLLENYAKFGENAFYNPRIPVTDLGTLTDPTKLLGMTSVFGKVPMELTFNKELFTGKPISYDKIETGKYPIEDIGSYLAKQTGLTSRALGTYQAVRNAEDEKNLLDNIRDLLFGKTTGIKPQTSPYVVSESENPFILPRKEVR